MPADPLKVYISADMEGVAGVVNKEQLRPDGFEFQQFRELMTAEVNAAINGAREAGATAIVVSDSHGTGLNLLIDQLPQDIELVRSWPRPLAMMEGIDETFAAAVLLGYHSSVSNPEGVAAHTISSAEVNAIRINGKDIGEAEINALIAGHFGVPVVMMSGDDAAAAEISAALGPIETAVTKWQCSHTAARTLMPEAARALIKDSVCKGVLRRNEFEPHHSDDTLHLELRFRSNKSAELLAYLPIVDRVDSHTVCYSGDIIALSKFIEMALGYPSTFE